MSDLCQATSFSPEIDFSSFPENVLQRQQHTVDAMVQVLLDDALSHENKDAEIARLRGEDLQSTLEGRILHMFALQSVRVARLIG